MSSRLRLVILHRKSYLDLRSLRSNCLILLRFVKHRAKIEPRWLYRDELESRQLRIASRLGSIQEQFVYAHRSAVTWWQSHFFFFCFFSTKVVKLPIIVIRIFLFKMFLLFCFLICLQKKLLSRSNLPAYHDSFIFHFRLVEILSLHTLADSVSKQTRSIFRTISHTDIDTCIIYFYSFSFNRPNDSACTLSTSQH